MSSYAAKQKEMKEKVAKETIYEAALKVISQNKHESLRMQEIAEAAGIATGTLYNYFDCKESLLYYVDGRLREYFLAKMQSLAKMQGPPLLRLTKLTSEILGHCEEYYAVFDLAEKYGIANRIPKKEKIAKLDLAFDCIKSILDDGVKDRLFKRTDTAAAAKCYFYSLIGIIEVQRFIGERNLSKHGEELLKTFQEHLEIQN